MSAHAQDQIVRNQLVLLAGAAYGSRDSNSRAVAEHPWPRGFGWAAFAERFSPGAPGRASPAVLSQPNPGNLQFNCPF